MSFGSELKLLVREHVVVVAEPPAELDVGRRGQADQARAPQEEGGAEGGLAGGAGDHDGARFVVVVLREEVRGAEGGHEERPPERLLLLVLGRRHALIAVVDADAGRRGAALRPANDASLTWSGCSTACVDIGR